MLFQWHVVLAAAQGTPEGECDPDVPGAATLKSGECKSDGREMRRLVREQCLGKVSCQLTASNGKFGEPCYGLTKYLAVAVKCSGEDQQARQEL